jgi:hypothetical protein
LPLRRKLLRRRWRRRRRKRRQQQGGEEEEEVGGELASAAEEVCSSALEFAVALGRCDASSSSFGSLSRRSGEPVSSSSPGQA